MTAELCLHALTGTCVNKQCTFIVSAIKNKCIIY